MSDVVEANDKWVLAMLKVDPVVLRTLPNGGAPAPEPQVAAALATTAATQQPAPGEAVTTGAGSPGIDTTTTAYGSNTGIDFAALSDAYASNSGTTPQPAPGEAAATGAVSPGIDAPTTAYGSSTGGNTNSNTGIDFAALSDAYASNSGTTATPQPAPGEAATGAVSPGTDATTTAYGSNTGIDFAALADAYGSSSTAATGPSTAPAGAEAAPGPKNSVYYGTNNLDLVAENEVGGGGNGAAAGSGAPDPASPPAPPTAAPGNAAAPEPLTEEELKKAMLARMPLSTTVPTWAKDIDMTQARMGGKINSGNFGTTSWIDGVGGHKLVIKTGKIGGDQDSVLANCAGLAHEAEFYQKISDKVGDHPNIAKCLGIQEIEGQRGLVLEGIRGENMNGTMARLENLRTGDKATMKAIGLTQPLSQSEFVGMQQFMLTETLNGMKAMEEAGVVHCDIRPDNIMVDKETGSIKLVDLGLAVNAGESAAFAPIGHGSVGPEFSRKGKGLTPSFDMFGAGEIARQGMERDQFRYGGDSAFGDRQFTKDYKEFAKLGPDGTPLHQALEPMTPFVSTKDKADYNGRMRELRSLVEPVLSDPFNQTESSDDHFIINSGKATEASKKSAATARDSTAAAQLRDAMDRCKLAYKDYLDAFSTGDDTDELRTREALGKVMSEVELLLPRAKTTGTYGAETEYTKFVNWAMNPNPELRPSAADALKHPFLADALMDEATARELMKKVLTEKPTTA